MPFDPELVSTGSAVVAEDLLALRVPSQRSRTCDAVWVVVPRSARLCWQGLNVDRDLVADWSRVLAKIGTPVDSSRKHAVAFQDDLQRALHLHIPKIRPRSQRVFGDSSTVGVTRVASRSGAVMADGFTEPCPSHPTPFRSVLVALTGGRENETL